VTTVKAKKPRRQCKKCPWKVSTNPHEIPGGYCEKKHRALTNTIAEPGDLREATLGTLRTMACHESDVEKAIPCVGWLANQLGPGNNIGLRLRVLQGKIDANVETVGEQHRRLEDTLP
jgi:hypothetical protein